MRWQRSLIGPMFCVFLILIPLSLATFSNQNEQRPDSSSELSSSPALPEYSVINEELYDALIKTQVTLNLLAVEGITEVNLRTLLETMYQKQSERKGFKYHSSPTHVFIYVYNSRERADSGMGQWVAMLQKMPNDQQAKISVNTDMIDQMGKPPEVIFGLDEETRKQIWQEMVRAEDRASAEAMKQARDIKEEAELTRKLTEKYKAELKKKYKLTDEQLLKISVEGLEKSWPFPKL